MNHWLIKSEPDAFSWDQQVKNNVEPWTGVRNHLAKRHLKEMKKGDLAFFYHSNIGREIVGIVKIVREAYQDPTATEGDWVCVDVQAVKSLKRPVTLAEIKADARFTELALLKYSRLSVAPVGAEHWAMLCEMGGIK